MASYMLRSCKPRLTYWTCVISSHGDSDERCVEDVDVKMKGESVLRG